MAIRIKGRPPGLDQLEYDIFWTEYRSIKETQDVNHDEEEEQMGECEQEIEWLKEAGFNAVVSKFRDSKEIDPNDADIQNITVSLTRTQTNAVRRRIDTLNASTKKQALATLSATPAHKSNYPADVRTIFPTQTSGQPSNTGQTGLTGHTGREGPNARPGLSRRAFSEGVKLQKQKSGDEDSNSHGPPGLLVDVNDDRGVHMQVPHRPVDRRGSEEISLQAGKQQVRHGSVFYVTGVTNKELFIAADKTKESSVDDIDDTKLKSLRVSPPDEGPESFREAPVDVPDDFSSSNKLDPKGHLDKPFQAPQFPRLPNFTLTKDELGVTRVGDLSRADMEKVRSLTLIELTALFDSHGLALHRRKPIKKKVKEAGIFGVPLQHLVQQDMQRRNRVRVPLFFLELIRFLEQQALSEEGILRVAGSATRIKALREEIEEKYNGGVFSWEGRRPNDCVGLLKQFLRELPFPILTHEYQPTFASVESIPDRRQQLQALNLLILLLPSIHRDCLKLLLSFLSNVISRDKVNKMNLNNVAMIMAPNLFLSGSKTQASADEVKRAQGTVNIVRMLIKYQAILWTIPGFMVMQVRYLYEAEGNRKAKDAKAVRKLLAKRRTSDTGIASSPQKKPASDDIDLFQADYENNIIRVKAPKLNKVAMAIQLTKTMNAEDVLAKFRRKPYGTAGDQDGERGGSLVRRGPHSPGPSNYRNCVNPHNNNKFAQDDYRLFEASGNIGERCLDGETNMLALYRVNRHAEWIIKPRDNSPF